MPRRKNKEANLRPTKTDVFAALRRLTQTAPSPEHFASYTEELSGLAGDRGGAIFLATTVENALDVALSQTLQLNSSRQNEDVPTWRDTQGHLRTR